MSVFISYSSKDYKKTIYIRNVMEKNGISCWMAPESIPAGSDYAHEIPKAIEHCDVFLLILSEHSQKSKWVPKELDLAISHNRTVIPFQIENVALDESFEFRLTNVQKIEAYSDTKDSCEKLIRRLKSLQDGNILGVTNKEIESIKVYEDRPHLIGLSVNPSFVALRTGEKQILEVKPIPENASISNIHWELDNPNIAYLSVSTLTNLRCRVISSTQCSGTGNIHVCDKDTNVSSVVNIEVKKKRSIVDVLKILCLFLIIFLVGRAFNNISKNISDQYSQGITNVRSAGSEVITEDLCMPDVRGHKMEKAIIELYELGFQNINTEFSTGLTDYEEGLICWQNHMAGKSISSDEDIWLTISIGKENSYTHIMPMIALSETYQYSEYLAGIEEGTIDITENVDILYRYSTESTVWNFFRSAHYTEWSKWSEDFPAEITEERIRVKIIYPFISYKEDSPISYHYSESKDVKK